MNEPVEVEHTRPDGKIALVFNGPVDLVLMLNHAMATMDNDQLHANLSKAWTEVMRK